MVWEKEKGATQRTGREVITLKTDIKRSYVVGKKGKTAQRGLSGCKEKEGLDEIYGRLKVV